MVNSLAIKSILRRQVNMNMDEIHIRIERIGNHGSNTFYIWTSIEPSEGIHPTIESTPLTKQELLTRIELLCDYRGCTLSNDESLSLEYLFNSKT